MTNRLEKEINRAQVMNIPQNLIVEYNWNIGRFKIFEDRYEK